MKNKIFTGLFLASLIIFAKQANAQNQNFDTVQIKTTKITNSIYMLEGSGGNIGALVGNDGIILIDDQFAPLTEKIKKALAAISDKPIRFVINTHFHHDHTGGNANLGGEGAIIVSQENNRKRLSTDQFIALFKIEQKASPYEALPKITFTESLTFHVNGETVEVFHVKNAHTDGDAVIYFKESNVIHTGDVFVRYGLPFIDQPNGGSIKGMIDGADRLLKLSNDETKIIPGHGMLAGKKDLQDYKNMLQTIRDRVADGIKKGKTLDQIITSNPAKEYTSVFDKTGFITMVYEGLKK